MEVVFLGGLSRAGKAAFWPLLCSVGPLDQPQNLPNLDWYNESYSSNDMCEETFLELTRLEVLKQAWFSYLGRNLNSNKADWTNFSRLRSQNEYKKRIEREDSEKTYKEFLNELSNRTFIPVFNTGIKLSERQQAKIGSAIHYIHIIRNPIRMFNEWMISKRVERNMGKTSRIMKYKGKKYPTGSIEDITADIIIEDHIKWNDSGIDVRFESLCQNPQKTMNYIADKCRVGLSPLKSAHLKDANVPRDISAEYNLPIVNKENLSNDRYEKILKLQDAYFLKV